MKSYPKIKVSILAMLSQSYVNVIKIRLEESLTSNVNYVTSQFKVKYHDTPTPCKI